jgi:uncharacterized membrane protein SpoIIM required for sporulation
MGSVEDRLQDLLSASRVDPDGLAAAYLEGSETLAAARDDPSEAWRVPRLNALVGAAHSRLFRGPRPGPVRVVLFLRENLPRRLWDQRWATLCAAIILLGTAVWTWAAVLASPEAAADILPLEVLQRIESRLDQGRWIASNQAGPELAASLLVHNMGAAVEACVLGVLLGVGSVWSLARNGAFLGGVMAVVQLEGQAPMFWRFLLPHAVVEFAAVFVAGGAGIRLGLSLLQPASQRRPAFAAASRAAAEVMVAVAALLAVAAVIETFVSSRGLPLVVGLLLDGATFGVLAVVLFKGRPSP